MEAYVAGDAGAFERLFRSLAPSVHAFFVRSAGDGQAAEDLLQIAFPERADRVRAAFHVGGLLLAAAGASLLSRPRRRAALS